MSIAKPPLSDIWANAAAAGDTGIADPGGLKDSGWTAASACPPFSWMNWILNKCDAAARYIIARGIPDYDANETYSVGDRVQWGGGVGRTFVCVTASVGDGSGSNSPGSSPTKWASWGSGVPAYRSDVDYVVNDVVFSVVDNGSYKCIAVNGHASPHEPSASSTYWLPWGHTDAEVVDIISANPETAVVLSPTGFTLSAGNVSDAIKVSIGGTSPVFQDLSFTLSNIPASPGYVDVALSSPIAFGSHITNVQVTGIYVPTAAWDTRGMLLGSNSVRIFSNNLYGPMATAYVRLCGY
jgi:hypothetical protein